MRILALSHYYPPEVNAPAAQSFRVACAQCHGDQGEGVAGVVSALSGAPVRSSTRMDQSAKAAKGEGATPAWRPDHTVIVVLENLSAFEATPKQIKGGDAPVFSPASDWRFLNELAAKGARFTNSHFARTPYGSGLPDRKSVV